MSLSMHVEELGQKGHPPLVLLHGWGHTLESFRPLATLLEKKYHLFLVDLPGFGRSPMPPGPWSSFDYADHVIDFLDRQGMQQATLLGHSFGGKVAMSAAARYPERVASLVLLAPSGLKRKRTWREACRFLAIRWLGKGCKGIDFLFSSKLFRAYFSPKFGSADWKQAGAMRPILVRSVNENFLPHVKNIQARTLLLWGEADKETPVEMAHRLHQALPDGQLIIYPHKGHHLYQGMGSHLCAYHLEAFLTEKEGVIR